MEIDDNREWWRMSVGQQRIYKLSEIESVKTEAVLCELDEYVHWEWWCVVLRAGELWNVEQKVLKWWVWEMDFKHSIAFFNPTK